jgi:hypothetical protein
MKMLLQDGTDLELLLRSKLHGKHSSLILSFNDGPGPNYMTVREYYESFEDDRYSWISEEEKQKAFENNSVWVLQWYPQTPVGFCEIRGSTLEAVIEAFKKEEE